MAQARTQVVPRKTTEVALPANVLEELAQSAKDESAVETPQGTNFSLRAGVLSFDGNPIPGNTINVIVLASAFENSYFDSDFDADNPRSPVCFAIGETDENLAPHANSLTPQHEKCEGCAMAEWGSDPKGGRGKACKEVRRLCLMPVDGLSEPDKATLGNMRIPVTSVKNWSNYVHTLAATVKRPPWSVITTITVKPNVKTQFQVEFAAESAINNVAQLESIKALRDRAFKQVAIPYSRAEELPPPVAPATAKGGKRKY